MHDWTSQQRTTPHERRGSRPKSWAARLGGVPEWVLIGIAAGAFPVLATAAGLEMRYLVYGIVGIALIGVLGYVVAFVGSVERLLWILLVLSLQLELAFTPIMTHDEKLAGPFGIMITPTLLCALLLVGIWSSARLWGDGDGLRTDRNLVIGAAAVIGTAMLSAAFAMGRMLSLFGIFELVSVALTALVANRACSDRSNISILRTALFVSIFVQSTFIIIEQTLGIQISLARGVNVAYGWAGGNEGRFAGTFAAPSCAATFLVVCLLFLFRRLSSKQPPVHTTVMWGLFALGFLALLLTRTRSGWIAFTIGCAGLAWQAFRDGTLSRQMANRLLVGGLVALLIAWPLVSQRLSDDHKGAADTRGNLVRIAVEMIKVNPIAGVGINTATTQVYNYAARAGIGGWVFIVHNQFLLVGAETGLPGLAALVFLAWVGLRAARRCMTSEDVLIKETGGALFWSLISMVWALNLDHVSGTVTYALFWFLIGAACGLDTLRQRDSRGVMDRPRVPAAAFAA